MWVTNKSLNSCPR